MTTHSFDIFASYNSVDVALARELNDRLVKEGFTVWFDKERIESGNYWHAKIEDGCKASRIVLPVMTPRWKESDWTKFETYGSDAVIPILYKGKWKEVATPPIKHHHFFKVDTENPDNTGWPVLFKSIRSLLAKPVPVRKEHFVNLQYLPNPYFVGREKDLNDIHEKLHKSPTAALTQGSVQAVTAMGGVKTTLAREYAEKFWRLYPQILWVNARTEASERLPHLPGEVKFPDTLKGRITYSPKSQLLTLKGALSDKEKDLLINLSEDDSYKKAIESLYYRAPTTLISEFANLADKLIPGLQTTDAAEKAKKALEELNERTERLLILDNAEDEESVLEWIPKHGGCRTIITSRFTAWSAGIEKHHVYLLDPESSREFLLKRTKREATTENIKACDELAEKLGRLPLALEQAAAYIVAEGEGGDYGFDDYMRDYDKDMQELLATGVLGTTEYPDSVITTWKMTTAKLTRPARVILRFSAFLAPNNIPNEMFCKGAAMVRKLEGEFTRQPPLSTHTSSPSDDFYIRTAIKNLSRYSMVTKHKNDFDVHALVQTVERFETPDDKHPGWIEDAVKMLVDYGPANAREVSAWPIWDDLKPHAVQLWKHTEADNRVKQGSNIPYRLASLCYGKGTYSEGIIYGKRALEIDEKTLGPDHPDVATSLDILAELYRVLGKHKDALPLYQRALVIYEKALGPDDLSVANTLNNLALLYTGQKRYKEALPLYQRSLEIREEKLGPDDLYVAISLDNLGGLYYELGNYAEALPLNKRALEIMERDLGPDHPTVANSLISLATLYEKQDRDEEALSLYQRALEIDEKAFGAEHLYVAEKLNFLVTLYSKQGRYEEALPLSLRTLKITEKARGTDHPDVVTDLNFLAMLYFAQGKFAEALPLFRRAAGIAKTVLGPNHQNTKTSNEWLKACQEKMG